MLFRGTKVVDAIRPGGTLPPSQSFIPHSWLTIRGGVCVMMLTVRAWRELST